MKNQTKLEKRQSIDIVVIVVIIVIIITKIIIYKMNQYFP